VEGDVTRPELLAAVLADADVLWAVATRLHQWAGFGDSEGDVRVAGPWARTDRESCRPGFYNDRDYGIALFASVKRYKPTTKLPMRWKACVEPEGSMSHPDYGNSLDFWTLDAAEQWCDARLREAGVLLASGPIETKD
jgi:hypothetical protein